jgi:hypothetical protein
VKKIIKLTLFVAAAAAIAGCQKAEVKNSTNTAEMKPGASNTNTAKPAEPAKIDTASPGSLATPTDAYKTAYAAREKKDIEGVKRVLSKDVLAFLTDMGEADHKNLDQEISQMFETPQAKTVEVRNEKITGNKAMLEYLDDGDWKRMDFVKEGDDWKMDLPGDETSPRGGQEGKKTGKGKL